MSDSQDSHAAALHRLVAAAVSSEPALDGAALLRHLERLHAETAAGELGALQAADLGLAFACLGHDREALARFEASYGPDIDRLVRRRGLDAASAADLGQRIRMKILVGQPRQAPKLEAYAGRGTLRAWVRVIASRMVIDEAKRRAHDPEHSAEPALIDVLDRVPLDPTTQWLRQRYRDDVKAAVEAALLGLDAKERRLLRGQLVRGLTTDELGALYGVHRTTAARWVERARHALVERTHAELRSRLGAEDSTVRSLVALVRSSIDLSVVRLLESEAGTSESES